METVAVPILAVGTSCIAENLSMQSDERLAASGNATDGVNVAADPRCAPFAALQVIMRVLG
jgi:hypothetical protein